MIQYESGSFGFQILFRFHGSAVFKAVLPALVSSVVYLILLYTTDLEDEDVVVLVHPYPIGALLAAFTFLLAFRANFSYNRYWEAMTSVHQMHSKWLDVGMELAAFHLQAEHYHKPPAFGHHPELTCLVERERERLNATTLEQLEEQLDEIKQSKIKSRFSSLFWRRKMKGSTQKLPKESKKKQKSPTHRKPLGKSINAVRPSFGHNMLNGFASIDTPDTTNNTTMTTVVATTANTQKAWDPDSPPLFLQEAAHLLSLLSAVAMSTLRNDLEQVGSPLTAFTPGAPWPHVDPDEYGADLRKDWDLSQHRFVAVLRYMLGSSRTPKARTLYNAARPFRVIGGVSDAEVEVLQAARGPLAKVALVTMWLQEFMSREHLAGSMGKVAPPIISRLFQFSSDGMVGYNQARKVAYIPFPFPHAQIVSLFVVVVMCVIPVLMLSFLTNRPFGFVLNVLTVLCFSGLHEVARELEDPFQNAPNDIPLNNFQAQFNESLITMFFGCHPDAYWELQEKEKAPSEQDSDEAAGDVSLASPMSEHAPVVDTTLEEPSVKRGAEEDLRESNLVTPTGTSLNSPKFPVSL